ncbi:MAG: hypothetical protein ACK56I_09485, partial [bacterium]
AGGRGHDHANRRLPGRGPRAQRGTAQMLGHAGERVVGNREHERNDGEAHAQGHEERVLLLVLAEQAPADVPAEDV